MLIRCLVIVAVALASTRSAHATLSPVSSFGANPGGLAMYEYAPPNLPAGRPLVVVLHGCTQTAANMEAAGWNQLADQYGFAVVYPEQQTANNPVRCFNWAGEYGDEANLVRDQGENASIMEMIDHALASHDGDPARVYVVGFSAGAAFAAVLAATWPDRIAGVAIMSGLPYRCATTVNGAFSCQSPGVSKTAKAWGDLVRGAHAGPYPRIQIWHGASDTTVVPMNRAELIKQWTDAHGIDAEADQTETIGNATRTAYTRGSTVVIESYEIAGMSHAVAIGNEGDATCPATAAAYFTDRGVCSTLRAAAFFGLTSASGGGGGGGGGEPGGDATRPTVAFETPGDGATITGALAIVVAATDDVAVDHVTMSVDGAELDTAADAPYQFDWDATAAGPGDHVLLAVAEDTAGNQASATITVNVPGDGGGGGGGGGGTPETGDAALPGCSLDAGGGRGGAGTFALLGLAVAAIVIRRR